MKSAFTVLIVDDEPLARSMLASLLEEYPEIEVIGKVGNVAEARAFLLQKIPDLIFLDVQMPGELGTELRHYLGPATRIVFVTAYEQYALKAFDIGAVDYLLKPVDAARLAVTLERIINPFSAGEPAGLGEGEFMNEGGQLARISTSDILWIEAQQNYTFVQFGHQEKSRLSNQSMFEWEGALSAQRFRRISRSLIIQVARIKTVSWQSRDETFVHFDETHLQLQIGRTAAARLKAVLSHPGSSEA